MTTSDEENWEYVCDAWGGVNRIPKRKRTPAGLLFELKIAKRSLARWRVARSLLLLVTGGFLVAAPMGYLLTNRGEFWLLLLLAAIAGAGLATLLLVTRVVVVIDGIKVSLTTLDSCEYEVDRLSNELAEVKYE